MNKALTKYSIYIYLFLVVFLFQSCKTDEFKFDEIIVKEDFGIKIIAPIYTGRDKNGDILEFRDFIHDWKTPVPDLPGAKTILKYTNQPNKIIPSSIIFDPSVIIKSLALSIQGNYNLSEIELQFTVSNSCPFPLNLQFQLLENNNINNNIPPIIPPSFIEADFTKNPVVPVTTVQTVKLDSIQTASFNNRENLRLTSWYNSTKYITEHDTISAHFPIDVSIVMICLVKPEE